MESLKIRCKECGKEIQGRTGKTISCGCPNFATIRDNDNITAVDLSSVVMLNFAKTNKSKNVLSSEDIAWQEARRNRKVRKLDFEVR
jgi:predicted ATP-dependent serine protease